MAEFEYTYKDVHLDDEDDRHLIQDFMDHAEWNLHSRAKDQYILGWISKAATGVDFYP